MFEVRVSEAAAEKITRTYGPERSAGGRPSEWDFWSGPLAGVLVEPGVVEIADYEIDPDYWHMIEDDPND